jgi:iduronate 2-sulfatase
LDRPETKWDKPAFSQVERDTFPGYTVRTERWRYTLWDNGNQGVELYDEKNDPHELKNLSKDSSYSETIKELNVLVIKNWPKRVIGGKAANGSAGGD